MRPKPAVTLALGAICLLTFATIALAEQEKVETRTKAPYGSYLTDDGGKAVYVFTADRNGQSACKDACAKAWPPMMTSGSPIAGNGVATGMLGTIQRPGGTQVTYDGKPLYYFVGDHGAGTVAGQGITHFGGSWYLISPRGMVVEIGEVKKSASSKW